MHCELFAELSTRGLRVLPGQMGENITTAGFDLLALAEGTLLQLGRSAIVRVIGLRNPCAQIEAFMPGLLVTVLDRTASGELVRKAGVMGVVMQSGEVRASEPITRRHVPENALALRPV